MSYGVMYD